MSIELPLQILDILREGCAIIDNGWRFTYVNDAGARNGRQSRKDLLGRTVTECFPGIERTELFHTLQRTRDDHRPNLVVGDYTFPDGSTGWYDVSMLPIPEGVIVFTLDVTDRRNAEERLAKSESLLSILFGSNSVGIAISREKDGKFLTVNNEASRIYGYPVDRIVGRTSVELGLFTPDVRQKLLEDLNAEQRFRGKELVMHAGTGEIRHVIFSWDRISYGGEACVVAAVVDISEQKQLKQREQELLGLFTNIALHIPGVIFQYRRRSDGTSHFPYASQGIRNIYGISPEEVSDDATPALNMIHRDDIARVRASLDESAQRLGLWRDQFRVSLPSGKTIWADGDASPIRMADGSTVWHGYIADITEQKKLDQQVLRSQRMESVGSLAGGIVHDMNNIIGPIMMVLQMVRKKLTDSRDQRLLDLLESNSKRAAALMKQILTFARGTEATRTTVQLRHLVGDISKFAKETFPAGVQVDADVPGNLLPVSGDPTQLHQVLLNLVVNARDAMPNGGKVTITAENVTINEERARLLPGLRVGPYVLVRVRDTGTGIPMEVRQKIFDPFFTTKELGKGTGLGLSTVLSIVKGHYGFVDLESEVGKGTEFKVYLPAVESAAAGEEVVVEEASLRGSGELVLLVDDEAAMREISRVSLEANGFEVIVANDGVEGIALYAERKGEIDLVITDIDMPLMDGQSVVRALRRIDPGVRVIGSSGTSDSGKLEQLKEAGFNAFLSKPYPVQTLLQTIDEVLHSEK